MKQSVSQGQGTGEEEYGREQCLFSKPSLKKMTFEQRLDWIGEGTMQRNGGRSFRKERKACAKALRKKTGLGYSRQNKRAV